MEEKKEEIKEENVFKKLLKKEIIISLVVGLLLGLIIMFFVNGGFAAIFNGKVITTGSLYNKMKDYYSINLVLEDVDAKILNKKYKLSDEELNEIKETADNYIKQYANYGYTQEQFLEENGFADYDEFLEYLEVDYKRTIYFYDYLETKLEENAVKNYYDEHAFGKVNTKHILTKTSDDMTDDQALALANDIIARLNNGEDFDTLAEEYTTNYPDNVITEDLGEIGAFDNIEDSYLNAAKELEVGKYSQTPVQTSYGYHVIYCVDKKEKTEEISYGDKMAIVETLAEDEEIEVNDTTYYQALIQMRKEAHLKFFDKDLKTKYEEYCALYVVEEEE
ncbi:MAG: peptidylprolyl isomerase [Clostridia bacterium]|nr:peptidylprolyl isomerase [Clostridia bacterium]